MGKYSDLAAVADISSAEQPTEGQPTQADRESSQNTADACIGTAGRHGLVRCRLTDSEVEDA